MDQIIRLLETVTLKDFIDIFIVALFLYNILLVIRGTRAVQMVTGLFGLGLLLGLSIRYDLYAVNWLLTNFFDSFIIILIILFQDQIRSALVTFGNTRLFSRGRRSQVLGAIEEVVKASYVLSREKVGALLVFERRNGLLNYGLSGTVLNAEVHSDIIYSIFQSASPLHDGAIIIRNNQIMAAGCFLPLSKNVEIDRHLGTRHRAAIGLTENTDAVVVIVSEETGKVSLCFEGIFYTITNESKLRRYLHKILTDDRVHLSQKGQGITV